MSKDPTGRPKRAADPTADADANGADDTPEPVETPSMLARRGILVDPEAAASPWANPFARPGSESAARAIPPGDEDWPDDDPADQPLPRRSALSSATPPEAGPAAAPDPAADMIPPPPPASQAPAPAPAPPPGSSWLTHHRRTLLVWGVGALVAAILVTAGVYALRRSLPTEPAGPSPSPGASSSAPPPVGVEDLLTTADADLIVPGASWAVATTAETRADALARAACLSATPEPANTLWTLQRTLGTSESDQLAAMHQIDVFASAEVATQVQAQRVAALAACDEVPALIVSSVSIAGLADEVAEVTVAYQNPTVEYRTVLLARTGSALTIVDVTRAGQAVSAESVAAGVLRSLQAFCGEVQGTCPGTPTFAPAVPLPADPVGWLQTADLPRITPGAGQWTAQAPGALVSAGMGCENFPLATEPGPASRGQRTYLLTQDAKAPSTFGLDEMAFDFNAPQEAAAFAQKLAGNLASCRDRVLTATVTESPAASGVGAGGVAVTARMFTIQQAKSDSESAVYQLAVTTAGPRVGYILASVAPGFQFSPEQLTALALRGAQRQSQVS